MVIGYPLIPVDLARTLRCFGRLVKDRLDPGLSRARGSRAPRRAPDVRPHPEQRQQGEGRVARP
ncbi:MAG TPA: hypothetical protein VLI67_10260, partial [Vicinamibacteria bacterium]|nr:hypothetical protein [Vicinamibacteria bacterium]